MGELVELVDVEEAVFRGRLAGKSVRKLAAEHRLSVATVQEIIERHVPEVDNRLRLATLQLELERLDAMQAAFYQAAVGGDVHAAAVMIKIQERRASYLALDCGVRLDPRPLPSEEEAPNPGATQQLLVELERIAAERVSALHLVSDTSSDPDPAA